MSAPAELYPGQPMTWEEYTRLGDDVRAEYVDGRAVMSPSPSREHQNAAYRLARMIEPSLPEGFEVTPAWSWRARKDGFIPDLMVHATTDESLRYTGIQTGDIPFGVATAHVDLGAVLR